MKTIQLRNEIQVQPNVDRGQIVSALNNEVGNNGWFEAIENYFIEYPDIEIILELDSTQTWVPMPENWGDIFFDESLNQWV
jgi:hypothetical protein